MKYTAGVILTVIAGGLIGFFGVLVSVFADSGAKEQLVTIAVILLIYFVLGLLSGYLLPRYSWKWGVFLGLPGTIFLCFFMVIEFNPYYILYAALTALLPCLGAGLGSSLHTGRNKLANP